MGTEQYKDIGTVTVTNASQIVVGASTDFSGQLSLPCVFKVNRDDESTYSVGTISSATRVILAANYLGSTDSGVGYIFCRSFTTNRGYWRPLQGDKDFAEILSQETIDEIDEDIGHIMSGNASVEGTITHHFKINTNSSAIRLNASGLTASRDYTFPDQNATLAGLSVPQTFTADQTINASLWVKGNASIDGALDVGGDSKLCGSLHVCGNASVDGTFEVAGLTTLGNKAVVASTLWGKANASIDGNLNLGGSLILPDYTRHIDIIAGAATVGVTAPTATTEGTARGLGFDADNELAFFNWEVPLDWNGTSDIGLEVVWFSESGDVIQKQEHVKWKTEYRSIAVGEAIDARNSAIASKIYTAPANQTDKELFETGIDILYNNASQPLTKGDTVAMKFYRHTTGEASSYSGLGVVLRWEVKYRSNRLPYM